MKRKYYESDWADLVKANSNDKILQALKYNLECLHESYEQSKIQNDHDRAATEIATLFNFMHDGCLSLAVLGYAFSNDDRIKDASLLTIREIFENYVRSAYVYLNNSSDKYKDSAMIFESMHRLIQIDWTKRLKQLDYDGMKEFIYDLRNLTCGRPFRTTMFDIKNTHIDMTSDEADGLYKMILLTDISNVLNSQYMNSNVIQRKYVKTTKNALEYAMNPDRCKQIVKYLVVLHTNGLVEALAIWLQNMPELIELRDSLISTEYMD